MSRVISDCFWTIFGHECSFVKESIKVIPRNTGTFARARLPETTTEHLESVNNSAKTKT